MVDSARLRESDNYIPDQSEYPSPTIPTYRQKKQKGKIVEDNTVVGIKQLRPLKSIIPALRFHQSHTIEHGVSKIIPE